MKSLPQIQFVLKAQIDDKKGHTTASLLRYCLDVPPQGGYTPAILRERARIEAALEKIKPGDTIKLEDADFAVARKCVEESRWGFRHPDVTKFLELWGL